MNEKLEILIVEDDAALCRELSELIEDSDDLVFIAATNAADKAVEYIKDTLPDAVILDLELHQGKGSGLNVLHDIRTLSLSKKPYILVTTNNSSARTYETARALGADYIMSKHQEDYSSQNVLDFLRIMRPTIKGSYTSSPGMTNTTETPEQYSKRIYRRIMTELNHVGISPKSVGYAYLADAIYLMAQQPTQNICTVLADKHKKSEASIERAMQNAIHRTWRTQELSVLLKHYQANIDTEKGSPTLTEFICYYANIIKNEYH